MPKARKKSEETKRSYKPDSSMTQQVELSDREFIITMINTLTA